MYHMNHLQQEPREDMDVKDYDINDKIALRNTDIVLDRNGKFQFQASYRPPPILADGYSHEMTYNKIFSVEATMMRHHQENKFEFTSLKRMMINLLKQTRKKNVQEETQESGEEEEEEESGENEEVVKMMRQSREHLGKWLNMSFILLMLLCFSISFSKYFFLSIFCFE
ncbi:unnamed protein product [Vicia faba]|uniref:Uncharacterized protein n=1 Tax=Vicia faba TaxID=3906 RepID=A0AAV0ZIJ7_VICFA|nr:unnamed protein product [Vicia faba]